MTVKGAQRGPFDVTREDLGHYLEDQPSYRADQVWKALYEQGRRPEDVTNLPKAIRQRLAEALPPALKMVTESTSEDGQTSKWLWATPDGAAVETVLMLYPDRATVCVSSQAGCAMNCSF